METLAIIYLATTGAFWLTRLWPLALANIVAGVWLAVDVVS